MDDRDRVLLLGADGQLGAAVARRLAPRFLVQALGRTGGDLTQEPRLRVLVRDFQPDILINAAAYTAVDRAEDEIEAAYAINAIAPGILAEEACRLGAVFMQYSTDYVFSGDQSHPYTEEDVVSPLNVYGASKQEGEKRVLAAGGISYILRTAWLYGGSGRSFPNTIERLAREQARTGAPIRVVSDQYGSPTSVESLARATETLLMHPDLRDSPGVYHAACRGETSWYGLARAINKCLGLSATITPIATRDYPTRAARPAYSVLSSAHLFETFGVSLPFWRDALREYAQQKSAIQKMPLQ